MIQNYNNFEITDLGNLIDMAVAGVVCWKRIVIQYICQNFHPQINSKDSKRIAKTNYYLTIFYFFLPEEIFLLRGKKHPLMLIPLHISLSSFSMLHSLN